jgi:hypothetical protein
VFIGYPFPVGERSGRVAATEIDAGMKAPAPRGRRRAVDRFQDAFRRRLRGVAIGLLLVNLALGLFARQQQHATVDRAIDIFDTAFISTNYVHLAQMSFQHFADVRSHATDTAEIAKANALLDDVLSDMDVAIERSTSPRNRAEAREVRSYIAALPFLDLDGQLLSDRLADIQQSLERLATRNTAVGLMASPASCWPASRSCCCIA